MHACVLSRLRLAEDHVRHCKSQWGEPGRGRGEGVWVFVRSPAVWPAGSEGAGSVRQPARERWLALPNEPLACRSIVGG